MAWEAAIAAGAAIGGAFLNQSNAQVARGQAADSAANQQALQMHMAQHGMTMRARDVMNAYSQTGIHPLAMIGMQAPSYTPVNYVGGSDNSVGNAIASGGQSIARSMEATRTASERMEHASRFDGLLMERAGLENELLRARIASEMAVVRQNNNPSMPMGNNWLIPGQGETVVGGVKNKSMERVAPGVNMTAEPGAVTDVGFSRTPTGWAPTRSKDLQDRAEDDAIGSVTWNIRNRLLPSLGLDYNGPFPAPAGKRWIYHTGRQEYQLVDVTRREGWDPSAPYRKRFGGPQ